MSKKISIYFISRWSYSLFNKNIKGTFGGAEAQLYQLGQRLSEDDSFGVSFVVGDFGQSPVEYYGKIRVLVNFLTSLRYVRLGSSESFFTTITRKWKKWMSKIVFISRIIYCKPDIVILRTADPSLGRLRFWTWLIGAKLVYMIASITDCSSKSTEILGKEWGKSFQHGLQTADLVITIANEQGPILKKNYGIDSVNLPLAYDIKDVPDKKYDGPILWVGRCCSISKRPERFLDLARKMPDEKFLMVASSVPNQEGFFAKIKKLSENIPNLEFKYQVSFSEVNNFFWQAKLFVTTSVFEGFGNVIVQAAKNKTPIVSFVNPDNIFNRYDLGFCVDGMEELYTTVDQLSKDPNLLYKKGLNAFNYAAENHDINNIFPMFKDYLKKCL